MPNFTIILYIDNDVLIKTNEVYGLLAGAPQIIKLMEKEFYKSPSLEKFKEIVIDHYENENVIFSEILRETDLGDVRAESIVIFNNTGNDIKIKSKSPFLVGEIISKKRIFYD